MKKKLEFKKDLISDLSGVKGGQDLSPWTVLASAIKGKDCLIKLTGQDTGNNGGGNTGGETGGLPTGGCSEASQATCQP
jgi:hypothetical protein